MSARRLPRGGEIDRGRPLRFHFDGEPVDGYEGDTLASALLASGRRVLGRSFKYRRPRGLFGYGVDEPNVVVDVTSADGFTPNQRATTTAARDGLSVRAVNASPTARRDRTAFVDRFAAFIPAGFYYKTFLWPDWHLFEPRIRAMAGLGRVDPARGGATARQLNHFCDAVVVGAGPVGLAAAVMLAESGATVLVADDGVRPGGSLLHRHARIDGRDGADWLAGTLDRLAALGVRVLPLTTAFGVYDHGLIALDQRHPDGDAHTLWRVRTGRIILAAGAIERPLPFALNDLPGIMSAQAGLAYLRRHAVLPGERIVVACNNSTGEEVARAMASAGAAVTVVGGPEGAACPGVRHVEGAVVGARGRDAVEAVVLADGRTIETECVLVSAGFSPTVHLFAQAKGALRYDPRIAALVPAAAVAGMAVVGGAAGHLSLAEGFDALPGALGLDGPAPRAEPRPYAVTPVWPDPAMKGRVWIDYQHDVTTKDVALAVRENFVSVEHLKRYTTLGMATDQGKTSALNGIALLGALTGRAIPEVGTTTYRPPFTPVPFASFAGVRGGERMDPVRRLALEPQHRAAGAALGEYGGWLRPIHYGGDVDPILAEARTARASVGLFDASPLGKIDILGPDAADFLDFIVCTPVASMRPGQCRYGLMLTESGIVHDDGVLVRLAHSHFVVSCSSAHVAGVHAMLEEWRQDRFPTRRIAIHDATAASVTLTVTGPRALAVLREAGVEAALDDAAFPPMTAIAGRLGETRLRIARVSFTGDRSYEISVGRESADVLWHALDPAVRRLGGRPIGVEAVLALRAEKGYAVVGKDTDGLTRPTDLGFSGPSETKAAEFVGKRSLLMEEALRPDRLQFVGLRPADGKGPLPTGAHAVETVAGRTRSIGYVTSSYPGVAVDHPVALGLIERGASRHGEIVDVRHLGGRRRALLAAPCAFDPAGERLHA